MPPAVAGENNITLEKVAEALHRNGIKYCPANGCVNGKKFKNQEMKGRFESEITHLWCLAECSARVPERDMTVILAWIGQTWSPEQAKRLAERCQRTPPSTFSASDSGGTGRSNLGTDAGNWVEKSESPGVSGKCSMIGSPRQLSQASGGSGSATALSSRRRRSQIIYEQDQRRLRKLLVNSGVMRPQLVLDVAISKGPAVMNEYLKDAEILSELSQ